jgi:hypothetical protein
MDIMVNSNNCFMANNLRMASYPDHSTGAMMADIKIHDHRQGADYGLRIADCGSRITD